MVIQVKIIKGNVWSEADRDDNRRRLIEEINMTAERYDSEVKQVVKFKPDEGYAIIVV